MIYRKRKYRAYSIEYRVKKEKNKYKKVTFFFLSKYPTKFYSNKIAASVERLAYRTNSIIKKKKKRRYYEESVK